MFHVERNNNSLLFNAKDHLVSKKHFAVYWDEKRQLAYTDPRAISPEVDYYTSPHYDSHKHQKKGLIDFLYRTVQNQMFSFKWRLIKGKLSDTHGLLDVGAGIGDFLSFVKRKGFQVVGVENNTEAKQQCLQKQLDVYSSLDDLTADHRFSVITLWHVLEHLPDPQKTITQLAEHLTPEGLLVIAVPNLNSHDAQHYQSDWAALDVPRHLWHFTPKGLNQLVEQQGFYWVKTAPMWFDAGYVAYLSEKQKGHRFPLFVGLLKGIYFTLKACFSGHFSSKVYCFKKKSD